MPKTVIIPKGSLTVIDLSVLPRLWPMRRPGSSKEARDVREQMSLLNRTGKDSVVYWSMRFRRN